jgi:hypothetical protein
LLGVKRKVMRIFYRWIRGLATGVVRPREQVLIRSRCPGLEPGEKLCCQTRQANTEPGFKRLDSQTMDRLSGHHMVIWAKRNTLVVATTSAASLNVMRVYREAIAHKARPAVNPAHILLVTGAFLLCEL